MAMYIDCVDCVFNFFNEALFFGFDGDGFVIEGKVKILTLKYLGQDATQFFVSDIDGHRFGVFECIRGEGKVIASLRADLVEDGDQGDILFSERDLLRDGGCAHVQDNRDHYEGGDFHDQQEFAPEPAYRRDEAIF